MANLDKLIGESAPMVEFRRRVYNLLRKVCGLRDLSPILIQGETGTRVRGPFVDVSSTA